MPIDSTADLLFRIGANSDDAEENIQRFRSLFGTSLGEMGAQFHDWAEEVFGEVTTVKGAMLGLGAGLVAAAGAALEAAHKYSEYVDEVSRGARVTGLSAENMSRLKFAADATHVSYDALVTGLTRFASTIVKANEGSSQQAQAFARLGITQAQLKAGEKDMLPLLEAVADRFKGLGSGVERAAMARELFSRGGPELLALLSQGSEGMKKLFAEADKLGLTIGTKDVQANEQYKASLHLIKTEMEALAVEAGQRLLPALTTVMSYMVGFAEAEKELIDRPTRWYEYLTGGLSGAIEIWAIAGRKAKEFQGQIKEMAESLSKFGGEGGEGLGGDTEKTKEEWTGLADALRRVQEASVDTSSVEARLGKELENLQDEVAKATKKFQELKAAGKLSPEDAAAQGAALAQMGRAFSALMSHVMDEIHRTNVEAGQRIQEELLGQAQKSVEIERAQWAAKIAKDREGMVKQRTDTAENLAALAALEKAGYERIAREHAQAVEEGAQAIESKLRAQREKTREDELAGWAQEIAEMARQYREKEQLTAGNVMGLALLMKAGAERINKEWDEKYAAEMTALQRHLAGMLEQEMTHAERLKATYEKDLAEFGKAQEAKVLLTAKSEAERAAIEKQFAEIRAEITRRYQADLQALQNSQGWQGVFGNRFAEQIKGNEALLKQWATAQEQGTLMVKVALESLNEMGQKAFANLAQGMGANIAHAMVYGGSMEKAMRQALAATLESIAAQSMVQAIYATALGFLDLAEGNFAGAGQAFTAAAIFGSVGAAAAVAGRAVAGTSGAGGAGGGSGSGGGSQYGANGVGSFGAEGAARSKDAGAGFQVGGTAANPGTHVTVNVQGHVIGTSGVDQLCQMLNEAVRGRNVQLTATNTTTGVQIQR